MQFKCILANGEHIKIRSKLYVKNSINLKTYKI